MVVNINKLNKVFERRNNIRIKKRKVEFEISNNQIDYENFIEELAKIVLQQIKKDTTRASQSVLIDKSLNLSSSL